MEQDQSKEELDNIELYLQALRKKVDHQLKNPFELQFANYSFNELSSWKNNVLQLDATSRLYGQRVDYLHVGTMQILGSVLNKDQSVDQHEQKTEIKKHQIYDNNKFQKYLQVPQKLNGAVIMEKANPIVWRQTCKKRDALSQLMLNELSLNNELRLQLTPSEYSGENYHSFSQNSEMQIYLKLLDFNKLNTQQLSIFRQIEGCVEQVNAFLIRKHEQKSERKKIQKFDIEQSFLEFDMMADNFMNDLREINVGLTSFEEGDAPVPGNQIIQNKQLSAISEEQSEEDSNDDGYNPEQWLSQIKEKKKMKKRGKRLNLQAKEDYINFKGMNLNRKDIFNVANHSEDVDRFIHPKDHLLLKFVRYRNLYPKKKRNIKNQKYTKNKQRQGFQMFRGESTWVNQDISIFQNDSNMLSQQLTNYQPPSTFCPMSKRLSFKQAVLPIKQMKRRIRRQVQTESKTNLSINKIKLIFESQQPLDIFITVLHIAAQQQIFVTL